MSQQSLTTISIYRRSYGYRYTELPVDQIDRDHFSIDCTGAYMSPERFDLRPNDIVRWRQGERYIEARIASVQREGLLLHATLSDAKPLPPEYFPY